MNKPSPASAPGCGHGAPSPGRRSARVARTGAAGLPLAVAVVAAATLAACVPAAWLAACGSPADQVVDSPTPGVTSPGAGSGVVLTPGAVVTSGPIPAGALRAATRYWRLVDEHRYAALLSVVTPDSPCAAAVRGKSGAVFFGIDHVRVVSRARRVEPTPPARATLEFTMTVDVRPSARSAWSRGRVMVFMCLRRAGARWLVSSAGTGP